MPTIEPSPRNFLAAAALAVLCSFPAEAPAEIGPKRDADGGCIESNPTGGDIRVFTCAVTSGSMHRLVVNFGGGHDDTSASLALAVDGRPADCDTGSKTSLFGEEGDVSLHCRIRAGGSADAQHVVVVTTLWSHAQYRNFVFSSE